MRITAISRLRHCRIFRDFTWASDLRPFAQYNLIYGWNGSGKTTISRILRDLELRRAPPDGEVTLWIGNQLTHNSDFQNTSIPVRVFNKDFVTENVFPVGGGDAAPILILGTENIDKHKELEVLKLKLVDIQRSLPVVQSQETTARHAKDQHCVQNASVIKDLLRGSGNNPFNNYDKRNYEAKACTMIADGDAIQHRQGDDARAALISIHHASPKPRLEQLTYAPPDVASLRAQTGELVSAKVVSATIKLLSEDAVLSDWVHKGLELHKEHGDSSCLFCQQPLPNQHLWVLEQHFNAAYETLLKGLEDTTTNLNDAAQLLSALALPNRTQLYDHLAMEFDPIASDLESYRKETLKFLDSLVQLLSTKRGRPFDPLPLDHATFPLPDSSVCGRLADVILKHNQACDTHNERVVEARAKLEAETIARSLGEYKALEATIESHRTSRVGATTEAARLTAQISKLEMEITEYRRPAEELNEDLRKYLGHAELQLEAQETGYTLTRDGIPATQLSEGETTAIALLYFLKSLRDRRFDISNGVVVLDDPISSLDANALYLAFGFIRERTKDASQLFILTHNFTLFRQVRNWFKYLKGQRKPTISERPAAFYMLRCLSNERHRYSTIQALDPLLERYESDYHYLFAEVFRSSTLTETPLQSSYGLPNIARRLLEAFLAFRQPDTSGDLWLKLQNVDFDEVKKLEIIRFVHTYSHNDAIGEPEHDPSLLSEAQAVLTDLLELIKAEDTDHFDRMVKVIKQEEDEGERD